MSTHAIKGYIVHETWAGEKGEYKFQPYKAVTMDGCLQINVCEHEIIFAVPEGFDPRADQVAALRKMQEKARADFTELMTSIERQIGELLALEAA